jgi:hypothetical protein
MPNKIPPLIPKQEPHVQTWSTKEGSGAWNLTFGGWDIDGDSVHVLAPSRLECVLPDAGAFNVILTFRGLRSEKKVGVEFDDVFFTMGAKPQAGLSIALMNRVLAATAHGEVAPHTPADFTCERVDGELRMLADGRILLDQKDPQYRLPIRALALHLPEGTQFSSLRVEAFHQAPALLAPSRSEQFDLSVCIDFFDDLIHGPWTEDTFRECMAYHRENHVRRVYFIDHFGAKGGWWKNAGIEARFPGHQKSIDQTFQNVGDFLPAAVRAGRAEGLEVFAVIKPFETGMGYTLPARDGEPAPAGAIRSLGGWTFFTTDFTAAHPHLRMERNMSDIPEDLAQRKIDRIRLTAQAGLMAEIDPACLRLWGSDDNGTYKRLPLAPSQLVLETGDPRRVVIQDLDIADHFLALTYEGGSDPLFGNRLDALVEVFDREGHLLPLTFSTHPNPPGRFAETGFVMNSAGCGSRIFWIQGKQALGFAVGVERYLSGALCPAYPKVRKWWLQQIQECIDAGVDGVDVRVCHHNHAVDWEAYGFNEPLVEAFQKRHGVDIRKDPFCRRDLRALQGEFYTRFLREARALLHGAGKAMHLHIELGFQEANHSSELEIFFDWKRWLDEGLADEVCIKNVRCMQSPLASEIANHARGTSVKKIHFNPSLNILTGHPAPKDFLTYTIEDALGGGADGFTLYENEILMAVQPDGSLKFTKPWIMERLAAKARLTTQPM